MLLTRRSRDSTTRGFDKFAFMTMELWDEKADGEWKFITDSADHAPDITFLQIVIRGTVEMESSESDNCKFVLHPLILNAFQPSSINKYQYFNGNRRK